MRKPGTHLVDTFGDLPPAELYAEPCTPDAEGVCAKCGEVVSTEPDTTAPLTLDQFRAATAHLPGHLHVTVWDPAPGGDWLNLSIDSLPIMGADGGIADGPASVLLTTHDTYDTRQH